MGIEPETRKFFILIVNSIALVLIWMIINVITGIYIGLAFFEDAPQLKNWLYYILALASLFFLLKYLVKKWRPYF